MILEKLHLDKESRSQRRERKAIAFQADVIAETLANSQPHHKWNYGIGRAPETLSVEEFASKVGAAAIERLHHYTSLEIAKYNEEETAFVNIATVGIGIDKLNVVPPPSKDVRVVFDRTATAKTYDF